MTDSVTIFRPNPRARLRLFCFPYAGAGASAYRLWPTALPDGVEVCPIQLPGRETRLKEPSFTRLDLAVESLTVELRPLLDRPFVLFGHSMGALLAFEFARQVRRQFGLVPHWLFASGRIAPQLALRDQTLSGLPDTEFINVLRYRYDGIPEVVLENPDLLEYFLPVLRADITLLESYAYVPEAPLSCPISVFGGRQDRRVPAEALQAWQGQTTATCDLQLFPGEHFFINTARTQVLGRVDTDLRLSLDQLDAVSPNGR